MGRRRTQERRREKLADQRGAGAASGRPRALPCPADPVETLIARSRKARAKGDARRAVVLLRQACALDEWRARSWTILGAFLASLGAREEAGQALNQARWLRARAGEGARAAVTVRLAERLGAMTG
jgi:Flp pilus assembly protein TadD